MRRHCLPVLGLGGMLTVGRRGDMPVTSGSPSRLFPPTMLLLRTFGGLSLENGGRPIIGAAGQRRRLAVLAVLAAAGDTPVSRDRLCALFWPDSDAERARGALKQALYALRRDVG